VTAQWTTREHRFLEIGIKAIRSAVELETLLSTPQPSSNDHNHYNNFFSLSTLILLPPVGFYFILPSTTSSLYTPLHPTNSTVKMQFSLATIILGFAALASAAPSIVARQNGNRPVPQGACCVANTSLKQDTCTAQNGSQGRCVPGGNDCRTA
jgi:hypothetical protein